VILGLFIDATLIGVALLLSAVIPGISARLHHRWLTMAAAVVLAAIPLVLAVLGYLEGIESVVREAGGGEAGSGSATGKRMVSRYGVNSAQKTAPVKRSFVPRPRSGSSFRMLGPQGIFHIRQSL
jgi:hypothetical protein